MANSEKSTIAPLRRNYRSDANRLQFKLTNFFLG